MTVEVVCDVCKKGTSTILLELHNNAYQQCDSCGLIFARWRTDDYTESNEQAFAKELEDYAGKASDERRQQRTRSALQRFKRYRLNGRFLELGCSAGSVLVAARSNGWEVSGVDISEAATTVGREQFGLDLHTGTLESARFPDAHFDVVYSNATLEHVEHPMSTLLEVARVLRPGGVFYCNTVNWDSYTREILGADWLLIAPDHHIHLFTPANVKMLCSSAGLRHLKTWTTGARVRANAPGSDFHTPWYLNLMKGPLSAMTRFTKKGDSIHFMATRD